MERKITTFAIVYFILGLLFAIGFAFFYHWPTLSFFSPGFYAVVLTWPAQVPGFVVDYQYYGWAGKILGV